MKRKLLASILVITFILINICGKRKDRKTK